MTRRTKVLVMGLLALVAATAVAFVVFAQPGAAAPARRDGLLAKVVAKVAANLGVSTDDLVAAFTKARIELIDEAVAEGKITAEQAQAMKDRLEARRALRDVMAEAIASGKITPEQLTLLRGRAGPSHAERMARAREFLRERLKGRMADRKCDCPEKTAP